MSGPVLVLVVYAGLVVLFFGPLVVALGRAARRGDEMVERALRRERAARRARGRDRHGMRRVA